MKILKKNRMCIWVLRNNLPARLFYESRGGVNKGEVREIYVGGQCLSEVAYEFDLQI
jgi:hypothetical protein